MKKNVLGGLILFATLLISYHFYYAHAVKGMYPPELILGIAIMFSISMGVFAKLLTIKNA